MKEMQMFYSGIWFRTQIHRQSFESNEKKIMGIQYGVLGYLAKKPLPKVSKRKKCLHNNFSQS